MCIGRTTRYGLAAEKVANLRQGTIEGLASAMPVMPIATAPAVADGEKTPTSQGIYRPYRYRKSPTRAVPPGTAQAVA